MWRTVWKGTAQDCIDHMRRTHKVPLSVKAANLARFFPPWTVTREQWADMMMPTISGVVIDTLLFSRVGSPLCHRYRIIGRTGSHAAFRGTYLLRLRVFLEESDSAVVRRLHHQLARELAARIALPTDSPASAPPRSAVGHTISEEDSRCSVDQMSVSSACLNLDLFSSSSEDDSRDLAERSDLSITMFCDSDEAGTRVNSDQVLSDGDFPEESVPEDSSSGGVPVRRAVSQWGRLRMIDSMIPLFRWVTL